MKKLLISYPGGTALDVVTPEEFDCMYPEDAADCFEAVYVRHECFFSEANEFVVEEVSVQ